MELFFQPRGSTVHDLLAKVTTIGLQEFTRGPFIASMRDENRCFHHSQSHNGSLSHSTSLWMASGHLLRETSSQAFLLKKKNFAAINDHLPLSVYPVSSVSVSKQRPFQAGLGLQGQPVNMSHKCSFSDC